MAEAAENMEPSVSYLPVEFYTKQMEIVDVPSDPFSVPDTASHTELNQLVQELCSDKKEIVSNLDFLVNGTLLRVPLKEFVEENGLGTESVIRIECVLRESAPSPQFDLPHEDWVSAVRANNTCLISGCYDNSVHIWSADGQRLASRSNHFGSIKAIAVVPFNDGDHSYFVSASQDQTLMLWKYSMSTSSLDCLQIYRGHERSVECVCSNNDGTRIISGGFDSYLKVWNTESSDSDVGATDVSTKKRKTDGGTISKIPMVTLSGHREAITGVCWSPQNAAEATTVSFDHTIIMWDLELAGQKSTLASNKSFTSVAVSPISGLLITGSVDRFVRLWDPRSKEGSMVKNTFTSHSGWISCVDWSKRNENLFVSGSYDALMKMWDVRSNKTPLYEMSGHQDRILACDWSVDSLILSGGVDNAFKVYKK